MRTSIEDSLNERVPHVRLVDHHEHLTHMSLPPLSYYDRRLPPELGRCVPASILGGYITIRTERNRINPTTTTTRGQDWGELRQPLMRYR